MKHRKKIFWFVIVTVVLLISLYLYLFTDTGAFDIPDERNLNRVVSSEIPSGKSIQVKDSTNKNIHISNGWFVDATGRVLNLRGINVSGSTKLPFNPNLPTHIRDNFYESAKTVSFIGRPFPLSEADTHFARLKLWGFQFIRLLITWEAIEHEGPGIYDQDYLDYLHALIKKAVEYNINVFIDPHQDVWSRFTGGDGAPAWTLEKAGFDVTKFSETGAAILHNQYDGSFPKMIWPTNYSKLAAATMFTLFFGGKDFAPHTNIDSVNIQDYLQQHYISAIMQVALKVKDLPNVIGFDTMNEPSAGYIGLPRLDTLDILRMGAMPTYFEGMIAGDGYSVDVGVWELGLLDFKEVKRTTLNPNHARAWQNGYADIWRQHGVWDYDKHHQPILLKPDYFLTHHGKRVKFSDDYWRPFIEKLITAIHGVDNRWIIFAEPALFQKLPKLTAQQPKNMVNAIHWYDDYTLVTKSYNSWMNFDVENMKPVFGKKNIRQYFNRSLGKLKEETHSMMGNQPTLIGEFGIPYDLNNKESFSSGDFSAQAEALDRSFQAMEANMLNYTLWNYTPDNTYDFGDNWNEEDLSIYSLSARQNTDDLNDGGRALNAVIRPYPYKVTGTPLRFFFNKNKPEFYLKFRCDSLGDFPTEIFIPEYHFGDNYEVLFTDGNIKKDKDNQMVLYFPKKKGEHTVIVRKVE